MPNTRRGSRLSADDWIAAALRAIASAGLDAVAVEPLATALGATKGSFYWHFANRRELISRTIDAWEQDRTDAVIANTDAIVLERRMPELLARVLGAIDDPLERALQAAAATDPLVSAAVARVTERRINYVENLYRQAGIGGDESRSLAVAAVALYLGHSQLIGVARESLPTGQEWNRHIARMQELLSPPV